MVKISGHTKVFAVLGHPVAHTLSPVMHNAAFRALGMDAVYLAFDVQPDRLLAVLEGMKDMGIGGVNITVPLKEVAAKGLPRLDESAKVMGAVNTIQFTPGGMIGHNTDGEGFLRAVREDLDRSVEGRSVFICGAGGAGRAVALACAGSGARALTLADADAARPANVAREVKERFGVEAKIAGAWEDDARSADLVVQATPLGMKRGDASPLGAGAFRAGQVAFDLVYMYPETAFMKAARSGGAHAANGLGMLLYQGARAFEIWTGVKPPATVMREALEKEVYAK